MVRLLQQALLSYGVIGNDVQKTGFWFLATAAVTGCSLAYSEAPQAGSVAGLTLADANQLVRTASGGQYSAVRVFLGPHHLYGVVVAQSADATASTSVMWITPDKSGLMAGTLLDSSGADLNQVALINLGLRFRPVDSLRRAGAPVTKGILMGSGGPILTVFIDPNCSYCHLFFQQVTPYVLKKNIRLRFVMVGVIKPDSRDRAAAILSATSPLAALQQDQDRFDSGAEEGGFPIGTADQSTLATAVVLANNALMSKSGIDGTPAFLYCSSAKPGVQLVVGMPQDVGQFLSDIVAKPAAECSG